jgi:hypothetical protein
MELKEAITIELKEGSLKDNSGNKEEIVYFSHI